MVDDDEEKKILKKRKPSQKKMWLPEGKRVVGLLKAFRVRTGEWIKIAENSPERFETDVVCAALATLCGGVDEKFAGLMEAPSLNKVCSEFYLCDAQGVDSHTEIFWPWLSCKFHACMETRRSTPPWNNETIHPTLEQCRGTLRALHQLHPSFFCSFSSFSSCSPPPVVEPPSSMQISN